MNYSIRGFSEYCTIKIYIQVVGAEVYLESKSTTRWQTQIKVAAAFSYLHEENRGYI